jgi:hypothetical protein
MSSTAPAAQQPQLVAANHFQLSGGGIHVTYAPFVESGLPVLVYQDAQGSQTFRGPDIQSASTEAGTVVSVVIRKTIDTGSTTFSILLPRVQVTFGGAAPMHTNGITAIHRFSVIPAFDRGQLDFYTFTPLSGTASHVLF